jgi:hypothetical protein
MNASFQSLREKTETAAYVQNVSATGEIKPVQGNLADIAAVAGVLANEFGSQFVGRDVREDIKDELMLPLLFHKSPATETGLF